MIELDEFEFPAKDYFWMVFWSYFVKRFWVWAYATIVLCAFTIFSCNWMFSITVSVLVAVCFLHSSYSMGRYYAYSKENNALFQKRKMSFGNDVYHIVCEDGSEGQGPLSHICKADILHGYYRLFVDNMSCFHIPVSVFHSEDDRIRFETEILGKKLKMRAISWKQIFVFLLVSAFLLGSACVRRMM